MKPERWNKIESIFHKALDAEEGRRGAVLEESCVGDEDLRREVEFLLAQHENAGSFIEPPAFDDEASTDRKRSVPLAAQPRANLAGSLFGQYRIVEEIGVGGMGVVYKAEDTKLGRPAALKFLPQDLAADHLALERFRREARAASALNHPNICTIYDIVEEPGGVFIAMEYLEGQTLAGYIGGRALATDRITKLGMPIAEALAAAHAKGVIHRDIKPGNIFVTTSGLVKVLDFGVAKLLRIGDGPAATSLTKTEGVTGTLPYMSPEQLLGRDVDARSDIYSLGVVLYEMSTGRRPYAGNLQPELIDAILNRPAAPPRNINLQVPSKLEEIILKCLAKDPEDRYQTAKEIAVDLRRLQMGTPSGTEALPVRPGQRMSRSKWAVAASIGALVVVGVGALAYLMLKPPPQPRIVGSHVLTKTGNLKSFQQKPFTEQGSLYFLDRGPAGWVNLEVPVKGGELSRVPAVKGDLEEISQDGSQALSTTLDPKRKQKDVWTQLLPAGSPRLIVKDASWPIWTADGRGIFFSRDNDHGSELYRANADGTGVQRLANVPSISLPHLSPDGTRIRFTEGAASGDWLWEVGTNGRNLHRLLGDRTDVYGGSWSPEGKYYFFSSWDGDRMSLWAISEAQHWWERNTAVPQQLTYGPMSIGAPAVSNDGKQLYAVGAERHGELSIYDGKSGKFVPYLSGASICYVDFSRDGQWIAYVSYPEGTLWRSRIDGSEKRQLTLPPLAVINPRWSPDGKLVAFTDYSNGDRSQMTRGSPSRVYVVSTDGGGPALLLAGQFRDPTWSPDGNSIAYDYNAFSVDWSTEVRILDLQTQKSAKVPGSERMWSPRWSPDGKYLVALRPNNELMLFTFASKTWEELASGSHGWPGWSPDSKFVYAAEGHSLIRVAISDHKKEQVASLLGFRATSYFYDRWNLGWSGMTPDGRPILLRDTGIQEIYAFDLEYK